MTRPAPFAALLALVLGAAVHAAESPPTRGETASARLVVAQDGVAPDAARLSAGLHVELEPGWKTYWRSPGEVGLPPELDWSGSRNVADVAMHWPAPTRFTAFEIENFGYAEEVVFPLEVALERPGEPVRLEVEANLLVCSDICVPETLSVSLDLPSGGGVDRGSADLIADWAGRVPEEGGVARAHLGEALTVEVEGAFEDPDVFPELGRAAFGEPTIRVEGDRLWASLPVLAEPRGEEALSLTVTDGARAVTIAPEIAAAPIAAEAGGAGRGLLAVAAVAFLGGLILNVMPCVLPVLGIKLAGAIAVAGAAPGRVRAGFLASAAGIMAFLWALGAAVLAAKSAGLAVGWGVQFQNPVFLAVMVAVTGLFAANLAGAFEIALPERLGDALGRGRQGLAGDFATGAFAAVLATPCSAPFLGTAVAFALAGGAPEVALVFTMLGLGLASPYLLVAARPSLIARLPRPGRWMMSVRVVLAALLLATALWLAWVLSGIIGVPATAAVVALVAGAAAAISLGGRIGRAALPAAAVAILAAVVVPAVAPAPVRASATAGWDAFDRAAIAERVAEGRVVFVDVTADWCLTCKANERLVLARGEVARALASEAVLPMRADWTRPDEAIRLYLEENGRFGIPFYAAYGPGAPDGIALTEVLTPGAVLDALDRAGGEAVADAR